MISSAILLLAIFVYFEFTVKDRIELAMIAQIKSLSMTIINKSVQDYINDNQDLCKNMIEINSNESGNIRSVSENMIAINSFKTGVSGYAQKNFDSFIRHHGIDVQLGNFTGLTIMSEFGPYIHMDVDATATIKCEIVTDFESCGVNQTVYHSRLNLFVDIYVGNPIRIESINFNTDFEISQTVIVGNIPNTYATLSRY